jgi:hypothetical protein
MTVEQNPEADMKNRNMEEVLIEVFGCISPDKKVTKIHTNRRAKGIKTEFYFAVNAMETMLIEVFGCSSMNGNAIKFVSDKDRSRINRKFLPDGYVDDQYAMPISVSA